MIQTLRVALRRLDGLLRRTQAGVAAFRASSADDLSELDRRVLGAVMGPIASVLAENAILRGIVSTLAAKRPGADAGEVEIAQKGAVEAAEERTRRGDFEGDA